MPLTRYLSYIQNSYASVHSFGTPSVTPCSVIPPSCPALSTAPVVVAIGPAGSVPIGRGDSHGTVWSVQGPVGVVVRFGVRSFGLEFWVRILGRSLVRVRGGYTITASIDSPSIPHIASCVYLYNPYSVAQPCPSCAPAIPSRIAGSQAGVRLVSSAARSGLRDRGPIG
jgi:hypothetical protein